MGHYKPRTPHGITLIELLVAISILAILLSLAIPSFTEFLKNNRVSAQTNELVSLVNLAKNEAIRRHLSVGESLEVALAITAEGDVWKADVLTSAGETAAQCDPGVIRCVENRRVEISPANIYISFDSRGYLKGASWDSVTICLKHTDCRGANQHRKLTILPSGRIDVEPLACAAACL